jgi:hypothetical protein
MSAFGPDPKRESSLPQEEQPVGEEKKEGGLRSTIRRLFSCCSFSRAESSQKGRSWIGRKVVDLTQKKDNRTEYDKKFKDIYAKYEQAKISVPSNLKVTLIKGASVTIWDRIRTGLITDSKVTELTGKLEELEKYLNKELLEKKEREKIMGECLDGIEEILKLPVSKKVEDKYGIYQSQLWSGGWDQKKFLDVVKLQVECTLALADLKKVVLSEEKNNKYLTYQEGGGLPLDLEQLKKLKKQIEADKAAGTPIKDYCQSTVKELLNQNLSEAGQDKYANVQIKLTKDSYSMEELQDVKLDLREELTKAYVRLDCLKMVDAILSDEDFATEKKHFEDVKKNVQGEECTIRDIRGYQREAKRILEDRDLKKSCKAMLENIVQKETNPKSKKHYTEMQKRLEEGGYENLNLIKEKLSEKLERIVIKENCQKKIIDLLKEKPYLAKDPEFQEIKEALEQSSFSMNELKDFQVKIEKEEKIKGLYQEVLELIQDIFPSLSSSDQKTASGYKRQIKLLNISEDFVMDIKDWIIDKKARVEAGKINPVDQDRLEKKRDKLLPQLKEALTRKDLSSQEKMLLDKEIKRLDPGQMLTSRILDGAERSLQLIKFKHEKPPPAD